MRQTSRFSVRGSHNFIHSKHVPLINAGCRRLNNTVRPLTWVKVFAVSFFKGNLRHDSGQRKNLGSVISWGYPLFITQWFYTLIKPLLERGQQHHLPHSPLHWRRLSNRNARSCAPSYRKQRSRFQESSPARRLCSMTWDFLRPLIYVGLIRLNAYRFSTQVDNLTRLLMAWF